MSAVVSDSMSRNPRYFVGNGFGVTHALGLVGSHREWHVDEFMARADVPWVAVCLRGVAELVQFPPGIIPWVFTAGTCNGFFPDFIPGTYRYEVMEEFEELCITTFNQTTGRYTNEDFDWQFYQPADDTVVAVAGGSIIVVAKGSVVTPDRGELAAPSVYAVPDTDTSVTLRAGSISVVAHVF